ncbi:MAG: hypothetical protein KC635_28545, partial [Myxococcales bacterium]|nr:hypothetical protein [Myxococcales bacterium]
MRSRLPRFAPGTLALVTLLALAAPAARAGVCDPTSLLTNRAICYGDGGIGNPSNVASGTFSPTTAFVQGSQICVRYDVGATLEQGGYDRVFLRLSDNLGGQQDTCLAGKAAGDCSAPTNPNGGCLNFPAVTHDLRGTACFSPVVGATQVTAAVYVAPVDLEYQCGDPCPGGGTLGVNVRTLAVTGCSGLGAGGACGNGVLDAGEQCDDGNRIAADGCGQTCQIEPGAICSADGKRCAGDRTCAGVTPGDLSVHYCYSNASNLAESTLRWTWQVRPGGQPMDLFWDVEGGVELFKNGEYDSLWLTWSDNTGVGESFFVNDGGLFQSAFYETWSRATRRIQPAPNATSVTVTFWVQSDNATSCQQPKAGKGPFKDLFVNALTLSTCPVTATFYDTPASFTQAMGRCYTVADFNDLNESSVGPFDGDGWHADVDTNQPGIDLTADEAPYLTTQALGDGSVALEAQGYGNYESNSRLAVDFTPKPQRAIGLNLIDAGDGNGVMAVEAYKGGRLVYVNNDIGASAPENNYITWKGIIFSEPVDRVVFFMIEGGDFFNIDNLVLRPQADADGDDVPDLCDCAPFDPDVATGFMEVCDDGIDNDCDLLTDGGDPDCGGTETQTCGQYADEQLTTNNGGWLTSGNQAWTWVAAAGAWRAVSADDIDATLETRPMAIPAGACDEVFKVAIDYGGNTEQDYDFLTTSYAVNGGAFVQLDSQSGNLAPKTYTLPASLAPGDTLAFRFRYETDGDSLGNDPTVSRVRLFSDADGDHDGVCDACDCAPGNGDYGADCDMDDDGYCALAAGTLNADPAVAGCDSDTPPGGSGVGSDCNDAAPTANPGHLVETGFCNDGLDNDCDGPVDAADLPDCAIDDCTDNDHDGYGAGTTCIAPDCDDTSPACTTDCSDVDQDGIPDCRDGCIDRDRDGYGVGPDCVAPDCDDDAPTCTTDCTTDADANGIPDCKQDCVDGDDDGYGVGEGCRGADCDDAAPQCTTDCSDSDQDGVADCKDECIDKDHDHYGVGQGCVDEDCNDLVPTCTTDCVTDLNGADGNGIPDCEEVCEDRDEDGYGVGPQCLGPDCDDTAPGCNIDCKDSDGDRAPDCADGDDDNDGLSDQGEAAYGSDPLNPDTDGDGLLDGQ